MFRVLRWTKKTFLNKNFFEFSVLGIINTFNTAWISSFLHWIFFQANVAAVLGYLGSLTVAFFLNCFVIFRRAPGFHAYIRFLLSYVPNFIIYSLVTFITINLLHLEQFWATVLASVAGGPVTFLIIKVYAFNQRD